MASGDTTYERPQYYGGPEDPYEVIKVIRAWGFGWNLGNVLKYTRRAPFKGDVLGDLKKAHFYLGEEIKRSEEQLEEIKSPTKAPSEGWVPAEVMVRGGV